jgi:NitT/TauT family transport system substrate-binding protein
MKLLKRNTFKRSIFVILGLTVTVSLYSLSGCQPQSTQNVYRIGLGPWVGFGPLYLAQEKGFFQEVGIKPELTVITGLAERNSALKSEKIDALAAPVDYFVLSAGNRLPTKIVMAIDESVGGDGIVAKKSIKSFQDLRGKKVAFQRGLPSEFFLRALLQQNGMTLNDLQAIDMETAQGGAAFIANRVDAAVLWEPWLTKAREWGNGNILASTKQHPDLIVDCLAFNQAVVAQHPEDVQKIVNVVLKAIDYWEKNPEEANKIMAPFFQVDAAKYAEVLKGVRFTDLDRNQQYFGTEANPESIFQVAKQASEIWLKAGIIQDAVNPESIISTEFIDKGSVEPGNKPGLWKSLYKIVQDTLETPVKETITYLVVTIFGLLIYNYKTGQVGYLLQWFLKLIRQPFPVIHRLLEFLLPEPILKFCTRIFVYYQDFFATKTNVSSTN